MKPWISLGWEAETIMKNVRKPTTMEASSRLPLAMDLDHVVGRLAQITDELLALDGDDYAQRFTLESERDGLREQAADFHQRKDENTPTKELRAELAARRKQLEQIQSGLVNRATQASAASGMGGAGAERALGRGHGGTINNAMMNAQGASVIVVRIAELEQELDRRDLDAPS